MRGGFEILRANLTVRVRSILVGGNLQLGWIETERAVDFAEFDGKGEADVAEAHNAIVGELTLSLAFLPKASVEAKA